MDVGAYGVPPSRGDTASAGSGGGNGGSGGTVYKGGDRDRRNGCGGAGFDGREYAERGSVDACVAVDAGLKTPGVRASRGIVRSAR